MAGGTDTSSRVERLRIESWRRMSPLEKLSLVSALNSATRELCQAGIRMRHPDETDHEVRLRMALITLGRDLAVKAYPEAASLDA